MPRSSVNFTETSQGKIQSKHQLPRSEVVSKYFKTDHGRVFSFKGREYLKPIYNTKYHNQTLLTSRQAEKTTFNCNDILLSTVFFNHEKILYTAANQDQVNNFVDRITSQIHMNPDLKKHCFGKHSTNNRKEIRFNNGSKISFRAVGISPGSARSSSVRRIYFDEIQSMEENSVPVVSECASHFSGEASYFYTGTPLSSRNILSRKYAESCQNEWIITCQHCKKTNPRLGIEHIDPTKQFLFCIYCGKDMNAAHGKWIPQKPDSTKPGFRICRLMTPTCTWRTDGHDGILDRYYEYSEAQFHQEVLGLPFDHGSIPVTEKQIYSNCEDYDFIDIENVSDYIRSQVTFGAIDWAWSNKEGGQAFTIFSVSILLHGRIKVLFVKRFHGPKYNNKPDKVNEEIAYIAAKINVKGIATDYGMGHNENLRLRDKVSAPVFEMQYGNVKSDWKWDSEGTRFIVSRTRTLDLVFNRIKKKLYMFPRHPVIKQYADDILNVYREYDSNNKSSKFIHAGSGPDDFLHLLNYSGIIAEHLGNGPIR